MNTQELTAKLRAHYPVSRGWAFLTEVPNGTGSRKSRSCDAIAMSLWPSKGLHLHGHEIKVSRSDWRKEMQDPSKAEAFAQYCHYWWIVAPKGLVRLEELPATWGLIQPGPKNLCVAKPATLLREPESVDLAMLAGLLRAASQQSEMEHKLRAADADGYRRGYDEGRKSERQLQNTGRPAAERDLEYLKRAIEEFEKTSGITITAYQGRRIGEAVRQVLNAPNLLEIANRADRLSAESAAFAEACKATISNTSETNVVTYLKELKNDERTSID